MEFINDYNAAHKSEQNCATRLPKNKTHQKTQSNNNTKIFNQPQIPYNHTDRSSRKRNKNKRDVIITLPKLPTLLSTTTANVSIKPNKNYEKWAKLRIGRTPIVSVDPNNLNAHCFIGADFKSPLTPSI